MDNFNINKLILDEKRGSKSQGMNIKDIRIGTQLQLGFSSLMLFVIILGAISFYQTSQINLEVQTMYSHPLKVRKAIDNLKLDILSMRLGTRDLMLAVTQEEKQVAIHLMESSAADAVLQFEVLKSQYLGPKEDIDEAYKAFFVWKTVREENTRLALSGEIEMVKASVKSTGIVGKYRDIMLGKIQIIDNFALIKAESLYLNSKSLYAMLTRQLILLVAAILFLSIVMYYFLLRNIRVPIKELTLATRRFHDGDLSTRSNYPLNNEFGVLSASFNILAESIEIKTDLDEKFADLAGLVLSEYDAKKFFQATLAALAEHTGSQMAAIYLLSDDKKTYVHFESIGVDDNARQTFSSDNLEGEFGAVLSTRKVQHLKNIPDNTRFVFHTVSGTFIPHEILTIPVTANNKVIAIISLATVSLYTKQSLQLIDDILVTLCARVEGILAYHKIKEYSAKLELQNRELESQKTEMAAQSSELMEQNTELEMQKNQLNEVSRLKTNFLSNMSHELRTPLNSVIALSGVLNRRLVNQIPEEEYSYLSVIERNGKHLLELINDILDISRIEAGKEEIEIARFDLNTLVEEIVAMIGPQARQKNIGLLFSPNATETQISSDASKCRHILQNLISNAVKFTESGQVEIVIEQRDTKIAIVVTDTGIGISEKHIPFIFDEFRQADGSTSRKFGGTGLGLAIAKKYTNLLGGSISVKSTPETGSEFTVILPLKYTKNLVKIENDAINNIKPAVPQTFVVHPAGSNSKSILLVEDNEPSIIQIKDFLEESGYQILIARNGEEALGIISRTIPDAILLDLMMPGMDGFEILRTLRNAEPTAHIPVLILTAKHITKEELNDLKRNNIHQLIQKGAVSRNELMNALTRMVSPESAQTVINPKIKRQAKVIEGKPVVLVVEDNPDNMLTVKALLGNKYTIIEAVEGNSCVELAKRHNPHLILMDIALPGMDGIEAFRIIRNDSRLQHIPVIALTASAMISDRETILAHGFDAYIAKPIEEDQFFKIIKEILYE